MATFPDGIRAFAPRKGAPDFIIADILISPDELTQWLKNNEKLFTEYKGKQQLRLQLKNGKTGLYVDVDTYKKAESKEDTDLPF